MNSLDVHFLLQEKMYFDEKIEKPEYDVFLSNQIGDAAWNFVSMKTKLSPRIIENVEKEMQARHRQSCFYFFHPIDEEDLAYLKKAGYQSIAQEVWMEHQGKDTLLEMYPYKIAQTEKDLEDYLQVYFDAYGGEKSKENPQGFSPAYTRSLVRHFFDEKFRHFIQYEDGVPVSAISLCIHQDYAGLYNLGTKKAYRKKGYGTSIFLASVHWAKTHQISSILLQTEVDSKEEHLYQRLGFQRMGIGVYFIKASQEEKS